MDEILQLREYIKAQRYQDALLLIGEMEEMAKDDKLNKVYSYCVILLIHLIKRHAEERTTASWDASVKHSLRAIARTNKRRNAGGYYLPAGDIDETLTEAFDEALTDAALEAFGGVYAPEQLLEKLNRDAILHEAKEMILGTIVQRN